ncbi:YlbF family regulator [Brevibacillus sp. SYP-B805]|uniref:YlbF family regulator n=1 Tax=Brevibacillus sp. SYP-B805 TaxID=1578199 RepID=UPI0013EB9D14|nr:YlbF family regulator [Brevibacillus sp. SYP-B805]NGQ94756.1 YlbF family regulator [Brevibacillus sp. SYP-B805]
MTEAVVTVDMAELVTEAHELSRMINQSREVEAYLAAKEQMAQDPEAQRLLAMFQKKKAEYEDVQRFGKYHPDYDRVSTEVRQLKRSLEMLDTVQAFKRAEDALDTLLYQVSRMIADAVSPSIKVPSNNPFLEAKAGGCGTGGSCGCSIKKVKKTS